MKDDVLSMQIEQARNGDEQAIAGLIARQMPQIRSLAAKAVRPGLDFDDAGGDHRAVFRSGDL